MRAAIQIASLVIVGGSVLAFGGTREAPLRVDAANEGARVAPDRDQTGDDGNRAGGDGETNQPDDADRPDDDGDEDSVDTEVTPLLDGPDAGKHRPHGGCPPSMVRWGTFCIDRYEAPNRRGAHPLVMQSANDANEWCADHSKRLCTEDEWITACQGDEHRTYPYGNEHVDGRCNDDKTWEKVDEALLAKWPSPEAKAHAKELYQATPSGSKRKCTSEAGARDMTGNVEEWVVRTREHANSFPYILIGCYWSGCYGGNKPTCHSTNSAHGPEFRFYETGFRCCKDAAGKK